MSDRTKYIREQLGSRDFLDSEICNLCDEIERLEQELSEMTVIKSNAVQGMRNVQVENERLEAQLKEATERGDFFQLENQKHLQELVSATEWRPMESAPKGGEIVIRIPIIRKSVDAEWEYQYEVASWTTNCFMSSAGEEFDISECDGWLPLPKPKGE